MKIMSYKVCCFILTPMICGIMTLMLPSATFADFTIDTGKVESAWLQRTNDLRTEHKLPLYTIEPRLTATASERSDLAKSRGYISHERKKGDGYYNYKKIVSRFKNMGIVFQNIKTATFSESIGYGYVSCKQTDCTQAVIDATRSTRNMYMKEKGKKTQPHYRALIHKYFTMMGVGISVDEKKRQYYITIHYGTSIVEKK